MTSTGGIQIRLGDLIYGILKRWKMILLLTFIGLVFGVLISAFTYMQGSYSNYQIDASFVVMTKNDEDNFTSYGTAFQHPNDYDFATDMVETVDYVIKSDKNLNRAIDSLKIIGIKPQDIEQNLDLSAYGSTAIVEATFTWRDAKEGIRILNAVLDAAQETLPETLKVGKLSVIDPPAARQSLAGTVGGSIWGYMTILGFLAGVGYVALELLMRPTLTNLNDMENIVGLESLGVIPQDKKYFREKKSMLVNDDVISSAVTQNYASTAFILKNRLKPDKGPHCFYVTSTITGEGKTTVAANLAVQLSDMECRVLLIDMDSRNPVLGKLFLEHVDYDRSLNALYKGDATVLDSVYTLTGYLDLLPMVLDRQPIPMEGTVFDLIKEIEKNYDYVIIDTAPVGHYSDVLSLNTIADTVLFVVGYDSATIPEIVSAVEKLDKSGIRILGSVVNNVQNLAGMARNEENENRKKQLLRDRKREPLAWEKAMGSKQKKEKGSKKKAEKQKTKKENKKNASKKKGLFGKRKAGNQQAGETEGSVYENLNTSPVMDAADSSREKPVRRNPLTDLMDEEVKKDNSVISDNDARDALFKIGMDGDFGEEEATNKAGEHALFEMFRKEAGLEAPGESEPGETIEARPVRGSEIRSAEQPVSKDMIEAGSAEESKTEVSIETRPVRGSETGSAGQPGPVTESKADAEARAKTEQAIEASKHTISAMFKKDAELAAVIEAVTKADAKAKAEAKAEAQAKAEAEAQAKAKAQAIEANKHTICAMFKKEAGLTSVVESKLVDELAAEVVIESEIEEEPTVEVVTEIGEIEAEGEPAVEVVTEIGGIETEGEAEAAIETEEPEAEIKVEEEPEAEIEAEESEVKTEEKPETETGSKAIHEADDREEDDYEALRDSMRFFF